MRTTRTTAVVLACTALGLPAAADARPAGPPARPLESKVRAHKPTVVVARKQHVRAHHLRGRALHLARSLDRAHGRKVRVRKVRTFTRHAGVPSLRERVHKLHHKLVKVLPPEPAPVATATPATPAPAATATATSTAVAPSGGASPTLDAIAACESGGNPTANTGNGFYGKYQFTQETWAAVGGTGNPAAASEAEQDARAAQLYAQQGSTPWPECGR